MKKMTQAEAHRWRKRAQIAEGTLSRIKYMAAEDWPGGVVLCSESVTVETAAMVHVAKRLGHAVVASADANAAKVWFTALPHAKEIGDGQQN